MSNTSIHSRVSGSIIGYKIRDMWSCLNDLHQFKSIKISLSLSLPLFVCASNKKLIKNNHHKKHFLLLSTCNRHVRTSLFSHYQCEHITIWINFINLVHSKWCIRHFSNEPYCRFLIIFFVKFFCIALHCVDSEWVLEQWM